LKDQNYLLIDLTQSKDLRKEKNLCQTTSQEIITCEEKKLLLGRAKHMLNYIVHTLIPFTLILGILAGVMILNGLFWGGAF